MENYGRGGGGADAPLMRFFLHLDSFSLVIFAQNIFRLRRISCVRSFLFFFLEDERRRKGKLKEVERKFLLNDLDLTRWLGERGEREWKEGKLWKFSQSYLLGRKPWKS